MRDWNSYEEKMARYAVFASEKRLGVHYGDFGLWLARLVGYRPSPLLFWSYGRLTPYLALSFWLYLSTVSALFLVLGSELDIRIVRFVLFFGFLLAWPTAALHSWQLRRKKAKYGLGLWTEF